MRMGELTGAEREKFEQQFIPKLITPEEKKAMRKMLQRKNGQEEAAEASEKPENKRIESIRLDERDLNSVESLQEKISKGIRDIFNGKKKEDDLEENQSE